MEHYIPKGRKSKNGDNEIGMICHCSLPEFGEVDKRCDSDLVLVTLPENEHIEMQVEDGKYVVHYWKNSFDGVWESQVCDTLPEACRMFFTILHRAIVKDCERNK